MPKLEAENAHYSPIYFAKRCLYDKSVTIYGAIGARIYHGYTGKEAMEKYKEEWAELDNAMSSAY